MFVCLCKGVTDRAIREAVSDGARSWKEVREQTGCAGQCGKCACLGKAITRDAVSAERAMADSNLAYAV